MDELRLIHGAEDGSDFAGGPAHDAPRLAGRVVDEAAGDLAALGIDAGDDLAALELTRYLDHADRQQALAVALQRPHGAGIEAELGGHGKVVGEPLLSGGEPALGARERVTGEPLLAGGERHCLRAEQAADALPAGEPRQHVSLASIG